MLYILVSNPQVSNCREDEGYGLYRKQCGASLLTEGTVWIVEGNYEVYNDSSQSVHSQSHVH